MTELNRISDILDLFSPHHLLKKGNFSSTWKKKILNRFWLIFSLIFSPTTQCQRAKFETLIDRWSIFTFTLLIKQKSLTVLIYTLITTRIWFYSMRFRFYFLNELNKTHTTNKSSILHRQIERKQNIVNRTLHI